MLAKTGNASGLAPSLPGRELASGHSDRSQANSARQLPAFDCLVLSGGGAKGAMVLGLRRLSSPIAC